MPSLDGWDWVLIATASFVAVSGLVRLMRSHRHQVMSEFRANMDAELTSQNATEKK